MIFCRRLQVDRMDSELSSRLTKGSDWADGKKW